MGTVLTMLVVFLDFDGVLNRGYGPGCGPQVGHLNTITDRTGAVIVVHSSWRWARSVEQLREILVSWGVTGQVLDKCPTPLNPRPTLDGFYVDTVDWDAWKGSIESSDERCIAIQKWLDEHPGQVERYVIFDDSSALGHFVGKPEFIQTHLIEGLTKAHADQALKHLKGVTG